MLILKNYNSFLKAINENETDFNYNKLNSIFWKKINNEYVFNNRIKKRLIKISEDFFKEYKDLFKTKDIEDIIITGPICNYKCNSFPNIDVHIIIDLSDIKDESIISIKKNIKDIKFNWDLDNNVSVRGYSIDLYINEDKYFSCPSFSLLNDKWIKKPSNNYIGNPVNIEEKYNSIVNEIEIINTKLLLNNTLPNNAKKLYTRALRLKDNINRLRENAYITDDDSDNNILFKKLKNNEYIDKLIYLIIRSYDKIYK